MFVLYKHFLPTPKCIPKNTADVSKWSNDKDTDKVKGGRGEDRVYQTDRFKKKFIFRKIFIAMNESASGVSYNLYFCISKRF